MFRKENIMTNKNRFALTEKEFEVAKYLVQGCTNFEIMEKTGISVNTIKKRITSIFQKMGVSNRTSAAFLLYKLFL